MAGGETIADQAPDGRANHKPCCAIRAAAIVPAISATIDCGPHPEGGPVTPVRMVIPIILCMMVSAPTMRRRPWWWIREYSGSRRHKRRNGCSKN